MDIWNADKLPVFLIFFLPGFISIKIYDLMVSDERRDFSKSLFAVMGYSALNFAVLFPLIVLIQSGDFYNKHFALYSLAFIFIMVGAPAGWPFALLRLTEWQPIARYVVHPIRKPWDYIFRKQEPFWIIVYLRDGQKIGGYFGIESFASSNPAKEQIYLEEVWMLGENDQFLDPIGNSRGILIMHEDIRAVEFFRVDE